MFVRMEVAIRPDYPDPPAQALLKRIQVEDGELRKEIRWARLIDVYWLEIPRSREEIIPACQEIFQDRVTQWLFTGNLIPSASGEQGGIEDLMRASPIRPGNFWGVERRLRSSVSDSKAGAVMDSLRLVLGSDLQGVRASTGQLLLLEGGALVEADLSQLARTIWCNPQAETWSFLSEEELKGNDRFLQDRSRRDERTRSSGTVASQMNPTLLSFASRNREGSKSSISVSSSSEGRLQNLIRDWSKLDPSQRKLRFQEFLTTEGKQLKIAEFEKLLMDCADPQFLSGRRAHGLSELPTWDEFLATVARSPIENGLPLSATLQKFPKPALISADGASPAVLALDESTWLSFGLRNSEVLPAKDSFETTLKNFQAAQRDLIGFEWSSLPLAQTHVHFLFGQAGDSARLGQVTAVEQSTTRSRFPYLLEHQVAWSRLSLLMHWVQLLLD